MCPFRFAVLTTLYILIGNYETGSQRIEFQAFDASEPLLRFQKPIEKQTKEGETHVVTLGEALLALEDEPMGNVSEACHFIMQHLAEQGGDFTRCLLDHARPFRMCEKCIVHYTHFTHVYEDLLEDEHCAPALLLADRMQVLTTIYSTFTATWADADCPKCYEAVEENTTTGEVTYNYTANTLLFQEMHINVTKCFNDSDMIDITTGKNMVCQDCRSVYREMNNKFASMKGDSGGHICMDLVDMMNYTRLQWSSKYNCTRPRPDASAVIAISVILFIMTILLYLTSKFIAKIRMPQIFKAKRMTTGSGRYGTFSHEEVDTSLPRFSTVSPTYSTGVERRRMDSNRDTDGNDHPQS